MSNKISKEAQQRLGDAIRFLEREIQMQRPGVAAMRISIMAAGVVSIGMEMIIEVHTVCGTAPSKEPSPEAVAEADRLLKDLRRPREEGN